MGSEDSECTVGSIPSKTQCILTYGGNERDMMINYALVAMNLLVCIKVLVIHNHNNSNSNSVLDKFYRHATRAFAFVVAFQIVLCLILGCSGISIVWCSMAGWIMSQKRQMILSLDENDEDEDENDHHHHHHRHDSTAGSSGMTHEKLAKMAQWAILLDLGALVYYLVVSEIITTIAHGCALVMGACLSQLVNKHSGVITTTRTITNSSSSETTDGTNEEPLLETTNQGERL